MNREPHQRRHIEERPIVKRYWQYGPRKPCGHARIVLSCKHCIEAARIEAMWNKPQQRSAS